MEKITFSRTDISEDVLLQLTKTSELIKRFNRQPRTARLRADAPGPRTAHPPAEGHVEYLLEPVADGVVGDGLHVAHG